MNDVDYDSVNNDVVKLLQESDFIYRIGSPKRSLSERLQLLIFKLILLLWEESEETLEDMEKKLELIDDIRHELTFLRVKYYKDVFRKKAGLTF